MNEWNDKVYWILRGQSMAKRFPPSSLLHTCLQFEAPFQPGDLRTFWMSPKSNIISSMRIKRKENGEESHGTCKRSIRHCLKQLHRNICTSLKCYRGGAPYEKRGHDGWQYWRSRDSYTFLLWIQSSSSNEWNICWWHWKNWMGENVSLMKTIAIAAWDLKTSSLHQVAQEPWRHLPGKNVKSKTSA